MGPIAGADGGLLQLGRRAVAVLVTARSSLTATFGLLALVERLRAGTVMRAVPAGPG